MSWFYQSSLESVKRGFVQLSQGLHASDGKTAELGLTSVILVIKLTDACAEAPALSVNII